MDVSMRAYTESDFEVVQGLMEKLQDYLVNLDPLKRLQRNDGYGKSYTENFLKRVKSGNGMIFLAEINGVIVGLIGGIIEEQKPENLLESIPWKTGEVIELIVDEEYRGKNIGRLLMESMERFFVEQGCDTLWVEVLQSNESSHAFYEKCGYRDRMIGMIKPLGDYVTTLSIRKEKAPDADGTA